MQKGLLVDAYKESQSAFLAAETAFMEPSLLALLYFPDDQKYAIYIPLFLPIMFPEHIEGGHLEPLRSVTPRRWEIDNLLRIRTLEQLTSAERTLQSLAQLLGEISNIVINDEVGASINSAVESIEFASELMQKGLLVDAYKESQSAFLAAETAFMEPSLLALLYFPDDQKYAIYIPLFLPIMFPVVLSLKNLLLWFRGKPIHKTKQD
ncbi:hypothetical protein B5X24_HaOG203658 [Helicoverpa armigera]|uniref:GPI transamidase component PIG-S n=1 Tax=Helicoverpa armigera TaxID=29058 RepID=A0A2W1BWK2_HELAM|nr:hypothetical protein B5X24_HaOG203658 [Helicoverpa armigera]